MRLIQSLECMIQLSKRDIGRGFFSFVFDFLLCGVLSFPFCVFINTKLIPSDLKCACTAKCHQSLILWSQTEGSELWPSPHSDCAAMPVYLLLLMLSWHWLLKSEESWRGRWCLCSKLCHISNTFDFVLSFAHLSRSYSFLICFFFPTGCIFLCVCEIEYLAWTFAICL